MKAIEGLVNYATFLLNFHAHFTIIMDLMNLTKSESQNIREPIKVSAEKKDQTTKLIKGRPTKYIILQFG